MCKPLPYYPLFVNDFDEDPNVLSMGLPEVGLYILALNESWKRGSIPADPKELAILIRRKPAEVCKAWPKVQPCWIENGKPGRLVNKRQEKERVEARQRSEKASNAATSRYSERGVLASAQRDAKPLLRASESESESSQYSQTTNSEETSTRAQGAGVGFDEFIHAWNRHRGFKKPNKALRERAAQRWESVEIDEGQLAAAMDGYHDSDWARKENYPVLAFVKDPHSWIPDDFTPALQDAPVSTPSPVTPTAAPSTPPAPRVDYPARWNELVPAKQCADWSPKREQHLLDHALDDPEFADSFDRVCYRVQKILTVRPDSDWLSFRWILGSKNRRMNWWRLLTEMEWMEKPEMSRSGYSGPGLDEAAKKRILDSMREDEDAED